MGRFLKKAFILLLQWIVQEFLFLVLIVGIVYLSMIYSGFGICMCGGSLERRTLNYAAKHGDFSHAWQIIETFVAYNNSKDCDIPGQLDALDKILQRRPKDRTEKEEMTAYVVHEILDTCEPHVNRIHLIRVLEVLTSESFEASGYPMHGWDMEEMSKEEQEAARHGIKYIREWWEKREAGRAENL